MIPVFESNTASSLWLAAASEFCEGRDSQEQTGRGGNTKEMLHAMFILSDPRQRWTITRNPALNPAFAIAEIIWILSGRNDAAFLNYWNSQLPKYAGHHPTYHGAYGFRLRRHFGIDQLDRAYFALKHNPVGRQVVLQIWDTVADFPNEKGQPVNPDIPCNLISLLKVRNDKLEWVQIMRSNDLFRGTPYNFIQFTTIQEVLAGWLGVQPGSYNHFSDSLHVYNSDFKSIEDPFRGKIEYNMDSLALPKEDFDTAITTLNQYADLMLASTLSEDDLQHFLTESKLYPSYYNLLLVLAAEAARKRGWISFSQEIMISCSNPSLRQIWERWLLRFTH
jgi:thymidylate synthase